MNVPRCVVALLALALSAIPVNAQERLDPLLRGLAADPSVALQPPIGARPGEAVAAVPRSMLTFRQGPGGQEVRAILRGNPSQAELDRLGVIMTSRGDDVVAAWVPVASLGALATAASLDYVHASVPMPSTGPSGHVFRLDLSAPETHATALRKLTGMDGSGVIVGVIDSGIDWGHPDFINPNGTSRILYLWDMSDAQGPPPPGYEASGGSFYTQEQINTALVSGFGVRQLDRDGHGTHVSSTAAGNGRGSNGKYVGIAPGADIIFVKGVRQDPGGFQTADQVDALNFINDYAALVGRPWVTNMSLGGGIDPHDGTSAVEREVDRLTAAGVSGRAVVIAAGNDGARGTHTQFQLGTQTTRHFIVGNYFQSPTPSDEVIFMTGWYPGGTNLAITITAPNGQTFGPVTTGNYILPAQPGFGLCAAGGPAVYIDNAPNGVNPINLDNEISIQIWDGCSGGPFGTWPIFAGLWRIEVTGTSGVLHMWMAGSVPAQFNGADAIPAGSVASPGVARNAITVGAYTTRKSWTSIAGPQSNSGTVGQLADFSSRGPTRDGRLKPEITAPGQGIVAALSKSSSYPNNMRLPGNSFAVLDGTSMATPHVTGGVAVLLSVDPTLDSFDLKDILTASARTDNFTGATPSNDWGYGKMSVLEAMRSGLLVGDANFDDRVDVADPVTVVNHILRRSEMVLAGLLAAETNIDGEINAADVVGTTNEIFFQGPPPPTSIAAREAASVTVGGVSRATGTGVSIPIEIKAPVPLAGIQLELDIGDGLQIGDPYLEGASSLTLDHELRDGVLTVVAYATSPAADGPGGTTVMHLPVVGGTPSATDPIRIRRALLVDRYARILDDAAVDRAAAGTRMAVTANRPNPFRAGEGTRFLLEIPGAEPSFDVLPLPQGGAASVAAGASTTRVRIRIYNVRGQLVRDIFDGALPGGQYAVDWDGSGASGEMLGPGLYFGEVVAGSARETLRMIMVGR